MIYLTAVHNVSKGSSFDATMRQPSVHITKPAWGITELSLSTFNRIAAGDHVLFYNKGRIVGIGRVSETLVDKELSAKLWGTYQHRFKGTLYWSGIVLFSFYHDLEMPFKQIIDLGEYDPKFSVRRIIQLNDTAIANILGRHSSEEAYVEHIRELFGGAKTGTS
jgi:hypothetical protein